MSPQRSTGSFVRAVGERVGIPEDRPSFMQGLAVGALVGAAIAGSTLWSRWRARASRDANRSETPPGS
jgi:hypothetical protein